MNQNLQGTHGHIDNRPQCATIDMEVPMARGLPNPCMSQIKVLRTIIDLFKLFLQTHNVDWFLRSRKTGNSFKIVVSQYFHG